MAAFRRASPCGARARPSARACSGAPSCVECPLAATAAASVGSLGALREGARTFAASRRRGVALASQLERLGTSARGRASFVFVCHGAAARRSCAIRDRAACGPDDARACALGLWDCFLLLDDGSTRCVSASALMDHSATVSHSLVTDPSLAHSFTRVLTCPRDCLLTNLHTCVFIDIYTYLPNHTPTYQRASLLTIAYFVSLLGTYSLTCLSTYVATYVRSYLNMG